MATFIRNNGSTVSALINLIPAVGHLYAVRLANTINQFRAACAAVGIQCVLVTADDGDENQQLIALVGATFARCYCHDTILILAAIAPSIPAKVITIHNVQINMNTLETRARSPGGFYGQNNPLINLKITKLFKLLST